MPANPLQIIFFCAALVALCFLIAREVQRRHTPTSAEDVKAQQLREAGVLALEWQATAEHAQALADMYAARAARLTCGDSPTWHPHTKPVGYVVSGDTGGNLEEMQ